MLEQIEQIKTGSQTVSTLIEKVMDVGNINISANDFTSFKTLLADLKVKQEQMETRLKWLGEKEDEIVKQRDDLEEVITEVDNMVSDLEYLLKEVTS